MSQSPIGIEATAVLKVDFQQILTASDFPLPGKKAIPVHKRVRQLLRKFDLLQTHHHFIPA